MSLNPKRYHCGQCELVIDIFIVAGPPGVDQPSDMYGDANCPWCLETLEAEEVEKKI